MKNIRFLLLFLLLPCCYMAEAQRILWEKKYSFMPGYAFHDQMDRLPDSSYVMIGAEDSYFGFVMRLDKNGDTLWVKRFGNTFITDFFGAVKAVKGGILVAARRQEPDTTRLQVYKLRYDGSIVWDKTYSANRNYYNGTEAILINNDNEYTLFGTALNMGAPGCVNFPRFTIHKIDSLGKLLQIQTHENQCFTIQRPTGLVKLGNSDYALCGDDGSGSPYCVRMNAAGDSVYTKRIINTLPNDMFWTGLGNIIKSADEKLIICGYVDNSTINIKKAFVCKIDTNFQVQWITYFEILNKQVYNSKVLELADSSLLLLTNAHSNDTIVLFRISPQGQPLDTTYLKNQLGPIGYLHDIYLNPDSTVMYIGHENTTLKPYLAKIDLKKQIISGLPEGLPQRPYLGQSYPNPANTEATIEYTLPAGTAKAELEFREVVTGRVLKRIALGTERTATVDLSTFSSGMYIYTLTADGKPVATKKMAVVK